MFPAKKKVQFHINYGENWDCVELVNFPSIKFWTIAFEILLVSVLSGIYWNVLLNTFKWAWTKQFNTIKH